MAIHNSIDYEDNLGNDERAEKAFEKFISETNAARNAVHYDYLITEEDGNIYVNEIGEVQGNLNGRRTLVGEDILIEGILEQDRVKEIKEEYERLV